MSNLDRYQKDVDRLCEQGSKLLNSMIAVETPEQIKRQKISDEYVKSLPDFRSTYEQWYSEALACISVVLPQRANDFISLYKPDKPRKEISYANYTISDYLRGVSRTAYDGTKIVSTNAALPPMQQQLIIVAAARQRFKSALFDIRALVQADLFDDELDAAEELNRKGFPRGAGAIAGVILEDHLATICRQHQISLPKSPHISDLNDALKKIAAVDLPTWRFIQHLGDLRNLCDHKKSDDPTNAQIHELIEGVRKITKTVF